LFYLYPKTKIELKSGQCKMGKADKQIGKGGDLDGENDEGEEGVGEAPPKSSPVGRTLISKTSK
jgi:hypothetical protein